MTVEGLTTLPPRNFTRRVRKRSENWPPLSLQSSHQIRLRDHLKVQISTTPSSMSMSVRRIMPSILSAWVTPNCAGRCRNEGEPTATGYHFLSSSTMLRWNRAYNYICRCYCFGILVPWRCCTSRTWALMNPVISVDTTKLGTTSCNHLPQINIYIGASWTFRDSNYEIFGQLLVAVLEVVVGFWHSKLCFPVIDVNTL